MIKADIKDILKIIRKNKLQFTSSCIIDLAFITSFFIVCWHILYKKIYQILLSINVVAANLQAISVDSGQEGLIASALETSSKLIPLESELISWALILALALLIIWIIFQGLNSSIAARIIEKKTAVLHYFGKFCLFSIFFYMLIIGAFWLTIFLSIINSSMIIPIFTQPIINLILISLLLIIIYFWFISLVFAIRSNMKNSFLNTFRVGILKIHKFLLLYIILIALIGITIFILAIIFNLNIIIFYLIALLFFIPLITLARIIFFYFVDKIDMKK
jgi:hypothetical protein